jgi:hypothetical protein
VAGIAAGLNRVTVSMGAVDAPTRYRLHWLNFPITVTHTPHNIFGNDETLSIPTAP